VPVDALGAGEVDAVVAMIAAEQVRPERNIAYAGVDADGIRAELDALQPPWPDTARVVRRADGSIAGAVIVEIDAELGRAWIYGPWVAGDSNWGEYAPALLEAALEQCAGVDAECLPELANTRLIALVESLGWRRGSNTHHALVVTAATVASWPEEAVPGIRPAVEADVATIRRVHDVEFPNTHTPADRLLATMTVLVATGDGAVCGYAAGRIQPDGEGYIDYVGVDPAFRRRGVGRDLVVALTRELMPAAPKQEVALSVDDDRAAARALYASLGFATATSFVAYRRDRHDDRGPHAQ
jgi:ribosomal protein S18 acetylase RimI-like enzyme